MNKHIFIYTLILLITPGVFSQKGPQPGDIYKEYMRSLRNNNEWRVTDPNTGQERAHEFLPNPVMDMVIDDLEGAVRAEIQMDIWGGHCGTVGKKFRFNDNPWIDVPDVPTISGHPECYMTEYNVIMEIPLEYLVEGKNTFSGNSGGQTCYDFDWGQWGWYVMIVRIYYDDEKGHVKGEISNLESGSVVRDNPVIQMSVGDDKATSEIQLLAKYYGYDENGDGYYYDWHHAYHIDKIEDHAGTDFSAPWEVTWNTDWVPDQKPESVSFMARIRDKNGIWFVTPVIEEITLERPASMSVKMYTSYRIPEKFTVRNHAFKSCYIHIDELENAQEAKLFHRTWNGSDTEASRGQIEEPLNVNKHGFKCFGENHYYALSGVDIPVSDLDMGEIKVSYTSDTEHHGIEILWPGPAIIIRFKNDEQ